MNTLTNKQIITFPIQASTGEKMENFTSIHLNVPAKYFTKNQLHSITNYIVHRAFRTQMINDRKGTANTKTRAEVRGGGKKPWKQKGTGRARAGSNRSPLWKGGGVSFGPKPKIYKKKINRKEWQLCLRLLLLKKLSSLVVVDYLPTNFEKTKQLINFIHELKINSFEKVTIVLPSITTNIQRAAQNVKSIHLLNANCLNIKDLVMAKYVIVETTSLRILEETYNDY